MKLHRRELDVSKLDWDNVITADLKKIWLSNFKTMKDIGEIRFHRALVPVDAISLNMEKIETADANNDLTCQLSFARTKIVPADLSTARAEMMAATLKAVNGHVVKLILGDRLI